MAEAYYNTETKQRFIDSIEVEKYPPRWWERLFEKSAIIENSKGLDLFDFSVSDLLDFYKYLSLGNIASLIVYNTNLVKYGEWALSQNLIADNQIHFSEIKVELLSTCLNKVRLDNSILTLEGLKAAKFYNRQDAFIIWCLFEGIKGKNYDEILGVKLSDINKDNNEITLCSGRTIKVSPDFIYVAIEADAEDEYMGLTGHNRVTKLVPTEFVFKPKSNSRNIDMPRSVYSTIERVTKVTDGLNPEHSAKAIRDSGFIHYLNQRAKNLNTTVRLMMYADLLNHTDSCKDIVEKYQFNMSTLKRWLMTYEDYLN